MSAANLKVESTGCAIRGVDDGPVVARTSTADDARRFAAAWNACRGLSTENLEDNAPVKQLAENFNEVRTALAFAIRFFDQLTPADAERMRKVLEKAGGAA